MPSPVFFYFALVALTTFATAVYFAFKPSERTLGFVRPLCSATIYSALGIDWTTVRRDDPFGRGFEYVPFAKDGVYEPIPDLWG